MGQPNTKRCAFPEWFRKKPLNLCQWAVLMIIYNKNNHLSIYKISQYARKLDECECYEIYPNTIAPWIEDWLKNGIVRMYRIARGRRSVKCYEVTKTGDENIELLRPLYEGYIT